MKYRAQLFGVPNLERPIQNFSDQLAVVQDWAVEIIEKDQFRKHPDAHVVVWEMVEEVVKVYRPKPVKETANAPAA